jgi:hypothetical protein
LQPLSKMAVSQSLSIGNPGNVAALSTLIPS